MGDFSPFHWLIVLVAIVIAPVMVAVFCYKHGKKVGDQEGYNRGYKEGQHASLIHEAVKARREA